jgi:hypothetical protein
MNAYELKLACEQAITDVGLDNIMFVDKLTKLNPTNEHIPTLKKILNLVNEYRKIVEPIRRMPYRLFSNNIDSVVKRLYVAGNIRRDIYSAIMSL